jgi:N12 class adenine-specific DNA methylase
MFSMGPKTAARANLKAIEILKRAQQEQRPATPEEQAELVKYIGWGSLAKGFEPGEWNDIYQRLRELLTTEEYDAAKRSTQYAMFTPPAIVQAMYDAVRRFGVRGGAVLEPSMGVGHFFGLMPAALRGRMTRVGVERDPLTAGIAALLYPASDVRTQAFEDAALPTGYFDLVIGNPPFGQIQVPDPRYPAAVRATLHDYFVGRSIALTRPDGILAFVISKGWLDKAGDAARRWVAERAELLGAIRLHDKALPGTGVTTDLIFLRRLREDQTPPDAPWVESRQLGDLPKPVNAYYHEHPDMVLGRLEAGGLYGKDDVRVKPEGDQPLEKLLREATKKLPADVVQAAAQRILATDPGELVVSPDNLPPDAFFVSDKGQLWQAGERGAGPRLVEAELSKGRGGAKVVERIKGLVGLRDAVLKLLREQLQEQPADGPLREALLKEYDRFVKRHGAVNATANLRHVRKDDPFTYGMVSLLDSYDPKTGKITRGDILSQRIASAVTKVRRADNLADALAVSLDERNAVDVERIAELIAQTPAEVERSLLDEGLVFRTPQGALQIAAEYLSGEVRQKLEDARAAAAINPAYERNVRALESVQPRELVPGEIHAQLGATWIPPQIVADFTAHLFGRPLPVRLVPELNKWAVEDPERIGDTVAASETWGVPERSGVKLLQDALAMRQPRVYDIIGYDESDRPIKEVSPTKTDAARAKLERMKEEFERWVWKDPQRVDTLAPLYNRLFNSLAARHYDGGHLSLPGLNPVIRPYPYQKDAVYRIVAGGNAMLDVAVGGGKTLIMTGAAEELKRLGHARKVLIVVQNATLESFANMARQYYPAGNFIVLDPTNMSAQNRRRTLARIAAEQRPVTVILPHQTMKMIPMGEASLKAYFKRRIRELEAALQAEEEYEGTQSAFTRRGKSKRSWSVKQMEKRKEDLENRLQARLKGIARDKGITFEELGIDWLMYDESQAIKNLAFTSQMQAVKGLGAAEGNEITMDAQMKFEHVNRLQNGRGVVLASGTPIANSVVEVFTVQRYLQPMLLRSKGIDNLDAWVNTFGSVVEDTEKAVEGEYKPMFRLRRFVNVPDLVQMWSQVALTVTPEHVREHLAGTARQIPELAANSEGKRDWEIVVAPEPPEMVRYMQVIKARAQAIKERKRPPQKGDDTMVAISVDIRHVSLDPKLRIPDAEDRADTKVGLAVDNIYDRWKRDAAQRLTQLVFIDMGLPKPGGRYSTYQALRDKLLGRGVPADEVQFIHDWDTPADRARLFDKVNAGEVRILIGSVLKMGVGVNVQQRLKTLHLLNPPYRPDMVEQAVGRAVRSGNQNREVELVRYVTKGSGDEWNYGLLFAKATFISQWRKGQTLDIREIEEPDTETLGYADVMAIVSKSPAVSEWTKAMRRVRRLEASEAEHRRQQGAMRIRERELTERIPGLEREAAQLQGLAPKAAAEGLRIEVAKNLYSKHGEAGEALIAAAAKLKQAASRAQAEFGKVGTLNGFDVEARHFHSPLSGGRQVDFRVALPIPVESHEVRLSEYFGGTPKEKATAAVTTVRVLSNEIGRIPKLAQQRRRDLDRARTDLATAQAEVDQPFAQHAELLELRQKAARLTKIVQNLDKDPLKPGESIELDEQAWIYKEVVREGGKPIAIFENHRTRETARWTPGGFFAETGRELYVPEAPSSPGGAAPGPAPIKRSEPFWQALSAEQRRWLRERGPDKPGFGLGAQFNLPDPRGLYARTWDAIVAKLNNLEGPVLRRVVDWLGKGIYGQRWGTDTPFWRQLQRYYGGVEESKVDAREVTERITRRMRELEGRLFSPADSKLNQLFTDVAEGRAAPEKLDAADREIYDLYRQRVNAITDEFLEAEHLHGYAKAFGLTNLLEVIKRKREGPGAYLRMLIKNPPGRYWEPHRRLIERPRIGKVIGGMFKERRSADLWTVRNADGTVTQFTDEDSALEHYNAEVELNRERYGTSVFDRVKVYDPIGEELLLAAGREPELDVRIRVAKTLAHWRHNLEILKLYHFLADTVASGERVGPDWRQLPDSPYWGPLAGRYVPERVAEVLRETDEIRTALHSQIWDIYQYAWKSGKTVWSPGTWGRNALGLNFFWLMDGIHPVKDLHWFIEAAKEFKSRSETYRRLVRENEIAVGYTSAEMGQLAEFLKDHRHGLLVNLMRWFGWLHEVNSKVGRAYDWPDQVSKLASYLKKTAPVEKGGLGWSHEEAIEALQGYPNYARGGDFERWITRHPLGAPFWRFTAASIRVNLHYARNKPARLLVAWMVPGLLTYISAILLGIDDEELDLVAGDPRRKNRLDRYFLPIVPWRDEAGRLQQLDLRWIFPLANDFRVETGAGGIGVPFLLAQPITRGLVEWAANRSLWTGRDIWREDETGADFIKSLVAHAFEGAAPVPTIVTRGLREIWEAATGDERDLVKTLLKQVFGLNVNAPFVRYQDAFRIIRDKLDAEHADAFARMIAVFNETYRRERDPVMRPRNVVEGVRRKRTAAAAVGGG